jgi:hypothetical protein
MNAQTKRTETAQATRLPAVPALFGGFERNASPLELVNIMLRILHGAREPVNARHDGGIAFTNALKQHLELGCDYRLRARSDANKPSRFLCCALQLLGKGKDAGAPRVVVSPFA